MAKLINNSVRHRYEMVVNDWMAYVTYVQKGNEITLVHTSVPSAHEGEGVGSNLAQLVLGDIRQSGFKVVAECPFIDGFIKRHPAFHDLLASPMQGPSS